MSDSPDPRSGPHPGMSVERLREIFDAYGASPNRWPADERTAAVLLLDSSGEARAAHAEALRLDITLDNLTAPPPPPDLAKRTYRVGIKRLGFALLPGWPGGGTRARLMRPVAFALTMMLGIAVGLAIPRGADPGEIVRIATLPAAPFESAAAVEDSEEDGAPVLIMSELDVGLRDEPESIETSGTDGGANGGAPLDDIPLI
ncbi:MAG: hypothetical protein ACTSQV_07390 [Alphaproteobacteria bacterium]